MEDSLSFWTRIRSMLSEEIKSQNRELTKSYVMLEMIDGYISDNIVYDWEEITDLF